MRKFFNNTRFLFLEQVDQGPTALEVVYNVFYRGALVGHVERPINGSQWTGQTNWGAPIQSTRSTARAAARLVIRRFGRGY